MCVGAREGEGGVGGLGEGLRMQNGDRKSNVQRSLTPDANDCGGSAVWRTPKPRLSFC